MVQTRKNAKSLSIKKTTINGRISKNKEVKKSNKEKGNELEEDISKELKDIGLLAIRHEDGYFDKRNNIYIPTGDGGIDMHTFFKIEGKENILVLIQCKNWAQKVNTDTVRSFHGATAKYKETGLKIMTIIVATNGFTETAIREAKVINMELIERKNFKEKIIELQLKPQDNLLNSIHIEEAKFITIEDHLSITTITQGKNIEIKK